MTSRVAQTNIDDNDDDSKAMALQMCGEGWVPVDDIVLVTLKQLEGNHLLGSL